MRRRVCLEWLWPCVGLTIAACSGSPTTFEWSSANLRVSYNETPVTLSYELPEDIVAIGDDAGVVVVATIVLTKKCLEPRAIHAVTATASSAITFL